MPLEPYPRGETWWAKGRVEFDGRAITGYIRASTGSATKAGALAWIAERVAFEQKRFTGGEEAVEREFTFMSAVDVYEGDRITSKYLLPIVAEIGMVPVRRLTPQRIRDLGPRLYPQASAAHWRRWVVTPARAVINRAADLGYCAPMRIKGYPQIEQNDQDKRRGKKSGVKKTPGSWEWLLRFRQHASHRHAALALFMFATGARVGQATAMHPDAVDYDTGEVTIPGAKGHKDRTIRLPDEVLADLRALPVLYPRGYDRRMKANRRLFGWADKDGPRKGWATACRRAGIEYLPPHSAGRHGFGQEMRVRQGVDKKAIEQFGGWSAQGDMVDRTYSHAEASDDKIIAAFRTGRVQAEKSTGLKLADKL